MKKYGKFFALAAAVLLLAVVALSDRNGQHPVEFTSALAAEIEMTPTISDSAGVDLKSNFEIEAPGPLDEETIARNLSVQPAIKFTVEDGEKKGTVLVQPKEPMEADRVYRFTLALPDLEPLSWAFQTKGEFQIVSTLPKDRSAGVPTNTGIEVSFSHLNFEKPADFIEITPRVPGKFEIHKKTVVFVPDNLDPATLYTVKVKKGLKLAESSEALEEDYVFQFETQDPSRHDKGEFHLEFFRNTMEFATSDIPVVPVAYFGSGDAVMPELNVNIYRYQDPSQYVKSLEEREKIPAWADCSRSGYLEDTGSLSRTDGFNVSLKRYGYDTFLEFPQALPEGFYLAEVSLKNVRRQFRFQVSDLAVYAAAAGNKTLVWVNDLVAGVPVQNAEVIMEGSGEKARTDEKGLASLPASEQARTGFFLKVSSEGKTTVAPVLPGWFMPKDSEESFRQGYWKYLYLDRSLYKTDDIVNFWGLLKPRDGSKELPERLTVTVNKWGGWPEENVQVSETHVKMDGFTFTGSLKLPNLLPGYYNMAVQIDDKTVMQQGFEVENFTKPAYRLEVEPDKKAIFVGETVGFKVQATCFEDTPVPGVPLTYYLDDSGKVTTDDLGEAEISYTPKYNSEQYSPVRYRYLYLNTSLPESGEITAGTSVFVLNNDVKINASGETSENKGKINIYLEKLTTDKINKGEADPWESQSLVAGAAAHRSVTASVFQLVWDKIPDGEHYDFINKKVKKRYRYQERKVFVTKDQFITDREGKAVFRFAALPKESYRVELTTEDYRGREARSEVYIWGTDNYRNGDYHWYYLTDGKENENKKYRAGEKISLTMNDDQTPVADRENGFLFMMARDGIIESQVQGTGVYRTVFREKWIPNCWVKGVFFDGRVYHEAYDFSLPFDENEKALKVSVKTDKEEYRPRDTVHVTVQVNDSAGRPVTARVNLNLVDEALYALKGQEVDFLKNLYGDWLGSGIINTAFTHRVFFNSEGGAEKGGEGESERRDFKDAAFFHTLDTDKNGRATVSFQVPDNLTAWRITYQAVTNDLRAGSGAARVKVKLPFFVDAVLNDLYLSGDKPEIFVRSLGTKLKEGTTVNYEVRLTGGSEEYRTRVSGPAFKSTRVLLPQLEKGSYQLRLKGNAGGLSDQLMLSFEVKDTFVSRQKTDFYLLSETTRLTVASESPVVLTFTDDQRSRYLYLLYSLAGGGGERIEQKLASFLAGEWLNRYFSGSGAKFLPEEFNPGAYQTPEGGVAILPYSGADLELSAKAADLCPDQFDRVSLKEFFYRVLNSPKETRERGIIALYGLAALEEPVLREVNLIASKTDLTLKEELFLILAQTELGDRQAAGKRFKEMVKKYGEENGPYLNLRSGQDRDDILEVTALGALAAAKLNIDEQEKMQEYVLDNQSQDILPYMEQLMFLGENLPRMSGEKAGFTYVLNGEKKEVRLAPGNEYTLAVIPEELTKMRFSEISGRIGVTVLYEGPSAAKDQVGETGTVLTRSYQVLGKPAGVIAAGDLVEINISYRPGEKAPSGLYQVTDFLPAGLKIIKRPYMWKRTGNNLGWPVEVYGQKAVFLVSGSGSLRYYARVVSPGKFTAENAILHHSKSGKVYGLSARDKVEIK